VVREPLRFWKFDSVEELIARRLANLVEVEQIVAEAYEANRQGDIETNRPIHQLALQGPELLKRVDAAKAVYEDLRRIHAQEQTLRETD